LINRKEREIKYILPPLLSIALFSTLCFGAENLELKDQKDKESYSLGGLPRNLK